MKRERISLVLFLISGFLVPAAGSQRSPHPAQTGKKPRQNLLQHEVAVTLKLVQVHVTDQEGNPARDLEISDFVLYDNGNLQEITAFEKHMLSLQGVKPEEAEPVPARKAPSALNRKFVFLLDYSNNDLEGISKSRKVILEFMNSQVRPTDEVALISFQNPPRLVVHEDLTLDHQKIRTMLQRPLGLPGIGGGWGSHAVLGHSVTKGEIMGSQGSRWFISCIRDLAKALRVLPGQKNIILFSRGIGGDVRDPLFLKMCRDLATANCPVFAVHTVTGMEKVRIQAEDSLENVATQTGGKYFPDVNYEAKISEDVQASTSNYYVLGYAIASIWDGQFHDIKVEVTKPGYKVYAQKGYFNPLPFAELSAIEKHLHLLGVAFGGKSGPDKRLDFAMIALPYSPDKGLNAMLLSEIPVARIRETIGDKTELFSLVFDKSRDIVDSRREVIDWEANGADKAYHYCAVALLPGEYDCRVVIRNQETGFSALGAATASVPDPKEEGLQLFPPLLLKPAQGARYLKVSPHERDKRNLDTPSIRDVFFIEPREFAPVMEKTLSRAGEVWASLRCAFTGGSGKEIRLSAFLEDQVTEERVGLPLTIVSEKEYDTVKIYLICFRVPELEEGQYALVLIGKDPAGGESSVIGAEFIVQ